MFVTNWISTTKIQKISEITNFFRHYFLSRTEVHLDQAEDIEVRLFSRDEVMDMLEKGEIWQSLMAAPLWKYFAKAK